MIEDHATLVTDIGSLADLLKEERLGLLTVLSCARCVLALRLDRTKGFVHDRLFIHADFPRRVGANFVSQDSP